MPTDRIRVEHVDPSQMNQGMKRWLITGSYDDGRLGSFQATTLSPFAASLCDVAKSEEKPILIQWREERYGKAMTYVDWPESTTEVA